MNSNSIVIPAGADVIHGRTGQVICETRENCWGRRPTRKELALFPRQSQFQPGEPSPIDDTVYQVAISDDDDHLWHGWWA